MKANYYIKVNADFSVMKTEPLNVFKVVREYLYFCSIFDKYSESKKLKSVEVYKVGDPLPKRVYIGK